VKSKLKLNTRTIGLIVGLALVVYGAAGYFLLVSPKKADTARLEKDVAAAQVDLIAAQAAAEPQDDTQPIAVADIFKLSKAMPGTPDMPGILLELARISEETGIRFTSITPQGSTEIGGYQVVPISVVFDGSFYALSDLLFRLRTLVSVRRGELHATGRLFAVQTVDFAESATRGFPNLTASLILNAYVYGTAAPANEVPPPVEATPPPAEGAAVPPPAGEAAAATGETG